MAQTLLVVLIGLIGGAAVGTQSAIVGSMGVKIGGTASSLVVHLSGAIFSGLFLFFKGGEKIREWQSLPWYMLASGVFGLILYLTISVTLPRLGTTGMVTLVIVGQLLMGMLVDHFGWLNVPVHPISLARVGGMILLLAGAYLISR